ncbi:hypothetical protein AVEN_126245-1 [Araneus ventricosus]|uniref:Uncharacterized protein n=1 Tax=Araneus ventricosus TaxID=182803 RepID=A0A4Y2L3P8_ARAVE|nr:hypothetical protein AVEN_126245-1 [Araneus ventricosus]
MLKTSTSHLANKSLQDVADTENDRQPVQNSYLTALNSSIIQSYNEFWGEYIDILQDDELISGCKYRIILQLPSILYVEGSSGQKENNSLDVLCRDLQVVNTFDLCESSSLKNSSELNELSSFVESGLEVLQRVHFPSCLNEVLKEKATLSRVSQDVCYV